MTRPQPTQPRKRRQDDPTAWGSAAPKVPEVGHETPWALVAYFGTAQGEVFPLRDGTVALGRAEEVDLRVEDDQASRRHAQLTVAGGVVTLEDLGSTNGTWVNGRILVGSCVLQPGDRLRIGGQTLKLLAMDALEWAFHRALRAGATLDPLTGLPNRRLALERLEQTFAQARRHGVPASIAVADLDHFKDLNDTHGHGAGDKALQAFAQRAAPLLRVEDTLGRIGGEEFLLVLPFSDKTAARRVVERVRWTIASQEVDLPWGGVSLTCSFGLAQLEAGDRDALAWMARADAALYRAKHAGRNRVCEG